jgi:hypothetical protein
MAETRFTHPEKQSLPAYSFGKSRKRSYSPDGPGPGAYATDMTPDVKPRHGGASSFGKSPREITSKGMLPGPGAYSSPEFGLAKGGVLGRARKGVGDAS